MHNQRDLELLRALDAESAAPAAEKPRLLGSSRDELEALAEAVGEPRYRGRQLYTWLYRHRETNFEAMTDLPKGFRQKMLDSYEPGVPRLDEVQVAKDGTRKYRFTSPDGAGYESVYIPEVAKGSRTNTLCVSSQTGCAVGCRFCFTASIKRNRNLAPGEIVGQAVAVHRDVAPLGERAKLTNIVFMGMGEPLLNYANVIAAARLLVDTEGLDFSTRRVTISTSGIVPRIYELGRDLPTQLAISLNATTNEIRDRVMPINKKWPLEELIAALHAYPLTKRRRFTIEYVLLRDVNDSIEDAKRLPKLLAGLPVKLNLLPLNEHERTEFASPSEERVHAFQQVLRSAGLNTTVRTPRGRDIAAACGQLGETIRVPDNRGSARATLPVVAQ